MPDDCLFCKIIAGKVLATVVYQDEALTAIRDIRPQAPTHILVLPNRHVTGIAEAQAHDAELLGKLLLAARHIAQQEGLNGGYRLVINSGPDAGQSVFHLHVHVLGGRHMRWPPG